MQRVGQNDRVILCKYDPTEPGDYTIEVKYSGKHVPGSPFTVMIFDTQDELNRFNQRQYGVPSSNHHHRSSHPPMDYLGSNMAYSLGYGQTSWRGSANEL